MSQDRVGDEAKPKAEGKPKKPRTEAQKASAAANLKRAHAAQKGEVPDDVPAYKPPEDEDAPQLLLDFWHVYHNSKWYDSTQAHDQLRLYFQDHTQKFANQMWDLEERWRAEKRTIQESTTETGDKGTEMALATTEQILKRLLKEKK